MGYKLVPYNGDTVAVPQLVFTHLTQADGDTVRAALYILPMLLVYLYFQDDILLGVQLSELK